MNQEELKELGKAFGASVQSKGNAMTPYGVALFVVMAVLKYSLVPTLPWLLILAPLVFTGLGALMIILGLCFTLMLLAGGAYVIVWALSPIFIGISHVWRAILKPCKKLKKFLFPTASERVDEVMAVIQAESDKMKEEKK